MGSLGTKEARNTKEARKEILFSLRAFLHQWVQDEALGL